MNGPCACGNLPWDECPENCTYEKYSPSKQYTIEDMKKAFEDGNKYGNDELELNTEGFNTAFEAWIENN
tara:strand:+ start:3290 stop:3496 length:207 start_codon:yes stop_codon:yes gene_type:complete